MMMDWTTCSLSDWATNAKTRQCIVQCAGRTPASWHPRLDSASRQQMSGSTDTKHMLT